jgi:membrane associated rhomboid family serine protease
MSKYRFSGTGGSYYRPSFFGGFSFFPPVIKALLISNVAIWLLVDFLLAPFRVGGTFIGGDYGLVVQLFALWPLESGGFWPWQVVSYMFLHAGFFHVFFNMLMLWMFGMELENIWGSKRFLWYYLICGLGAGLTHIVVNMLMGQQGHVVGASGAVYGVLVAFAMLFPDRPVYVYFLLPVRAKFLIIGFILIDIIGSMSTTSRVAHFAHLGGAAVGFVLVTLMAQGFSLNFVWDLFKRSPSPRYQQRRARKPVHEEIYDAKFFDINTGRSLGDERELNQEVVDAILDKINTSGYQSLTEEEKRILNEASKKIN